MREYENRFDKHVDADLKVGIVLELAPTNVREHIHVNSDSTTLTYESVRERIVNYLEAKTGDQDESQAMDVDALTKRLNALEKGKGKGKKGKKGKGKGKEFGKGKKGDGESKDGNKNGKGKGQQNVASGKGSGSDKINGYCSICWGWGHPARICWYGQTNNALTGGATTDEPTQQAQPGGTSTSAAQQVGTQNCLTQDVGNKDWMLVFTRTHAQDMERNLLSMQDDIKGPERVRVLIDTCSAGSVAPPCIGQHFELIRKDLRPHRSAMGDYVSVKGFRKFVMDTGESIATHAFEVATTRRHRQVLSLRISAATIASNGNQIILDDRMGGWIVNKTNRSIRLRKNNNIYEFEATL